MGKKLTPDDIAKVGTEEAIQSALMHALAIYLADYDADCMLIYHIPNGGYRGNAKMAAIVGNKMKAAGVKRGVPDLHLPVPRKGFHGLYLEMKKPVGDSGLSIEQVSYVDSLARCGYVVGIADDWRDGYAFISGYFDKTITADDYTVRTLNASTALGHKIFDPKGHYEKAVREKRRRIVQK